MEASERQKADQVYAKFKKKLEADHFGKIVAIDTNSGEIVGIGGTKIKPIIFPGEFVAGLGIGFGIRSQTTPT